MARSKPIMAALGDDQLALLADNGVLRLRPDPLRVTWKLAGLRSSDGHQVDAAFTASVRALDQPLERKMLAENLLLARRAITCGDVAAHFQTDLALAAAASLKSEPIETWMAAEPRERIIQALKQTAGRKAFACGLEVLAPYELTLDSESYRQAELRHRERLLAEQQAAGQVEHMRAAVNLLEQFTELRKTHPDLDASRLLAQVAPSDQGQMLRALLMASAEDLPELPLWLVAGGTLARVDVASARPEPKPTAMPTTLGPLRSVSASRLDERSILLLGARSGVLMVSDPAKPDAVTAYADQGVASQMGFSRAVIWNRGIWACHSEAGVVAWDLERIDAPAHAVRPAELATAVGSGELCGARNLVALDEKRLLVSCGAALAVIEKGARVASAPPAPTAASIVAILFAGGKVVVVHEDGHLVVRESGGLTILESVNRGQPVVAAAALPWLSTTRILLSQRSGSLSCQGLNDILYTEYTASLSGMRAVVGSGRWVAAVSSDRQRVLLWRSWEPSRPSAEIYATGLLHHRVADLCFA